MAVEGDCSFGSWFSRLTGMESNSIWYGVGVSSYSRQRDNTRRLYELTSSLE